MKRGIYNWLGLGLVVCLELLAACLPSTTATFRPAVPANFIPSSALRISRLWLREDVGKSYRTTAVSLGTAIGPDLVLTHNHFHMPAGHLQSEATVFVNGAGQAVSTSDADLNTLIVYGDLTVFRTPRQLQSSTAPVASRGVIDSLLVDDWLAVNYLDDASDRILSKEFQIIRVQAGLVTLADPETIINQGDSGGGAFLHGELVGCTQSINVDEDGQPTGRFNVGLLPVALTFFAR